MKFSLTPGLTRTIAIDTIGTIKPLYTKSAFDKLTYMSEHYSDMRTKKSAHDALIHLSGINSINDAFAAKTIGYAKKENACMKSFKKSVRYLHLNDY